MKDSTGNVIGLCQGINKLSGAFSEDDEHLLTIISESASYQMHNSIQTEQMTPLQHKLRKAIEVL